MTDQTPRDEGPAVPEATFPPCTVLPQLLKFSDVARVLSCSVRTVYNLVEQGELEKKKLGQAQSSGVRITLESLQAYLVRSGTTTDQVSETGDVK